ncbi:uncharacterized protein LOC113305643 [Papaver somniferum]|uniref:uncharacterized protein LOC113305643 n=1 Tax=Papaver somniferum TaxID=3469 RepID=UPI000E6FB660|nr:uncharacterized protein LOC113305643 [Papaver somniferum]
MVLGDLNFHLLNKGQSSKNNSLDNWVRNIIDSAGLMDLGFIGSNYTWSNRTDGKGYRRGSNLSLNDKINHTRKKLEKWNKEDFGKISDHLKYYQSRLSQLQSLPYSPATSFQIQEIIDSLKHWEKIESEFWQQKSGDRWVKDEDNNHTKANIRRSRNNITSLRDSSGRWYHNTQDLENLLTHHFSSIATSTAPKIQESSFDIIQRIVSQEDNEKMLAVPDKEEVYSPLMSMSSWTALGQDGFL